MTFHYHGTPITPKSVLYDLSGRHFCVSHAHPEQVRVVHEIGQSVMLDNGAFPAWRGKYIPVWPKYYAWCEAWLEWLTTWAVIPDVIDGDEECQDRLIAEWPHGLRGVPVWHMHESVARLIRLVERWGKVCIGSSKQYATLLTDSWCCRMDQVWNALIRAFGRVPWTHMLRGMQLVFHSWPFASVDSTDVARNHNRPKNTARAMAERWDAKQCPAVWEMQMEQGLLFEAA